MIRTIVSCIRPIVCQLGSGRWLGTSTPKDNRIDGNQRQTPTEHCHSTGYVHQRIFGSNPQTRTRGHRHSVETHQRSKYGMLYDQTIFSIAPCLDCIYLRSLSPDLQCPHPGHRWITRCFLGGRIANGPTPCIIPVPYDRPL